MAQAQEPGTSEFLTARGTRRFFDDVSDSVFRELRQLPAGDGKHLLAEVKLALEREVAVEQQFRQEFGTAREEALRAGTAEELARSFRMLYGLVTAYFVRRDSAPAFHALSATVIDTVIGRALQLAEGVLAERGYGTPPRYAWLVLGSAGRREAALSDEVESLLVHEAGADAAEYCAELAGLTSANLDRCGLAKSGRGITPDIPAWRAPLEGWRDRFEDICRRSFGPRLASLPTLPGLRLEELLPFRRTNLSTPLFELADLRCASGDDGLGEDLRQLFRETAVQHPACITEAARSVAALPSPFTFLGNYRVERVGPHRGTLDLERWAALPLVTMVRFLAVSDGVVETATLDRIRSLMRRGSLDVELGKRLIKGGLEIFRLKALLQVREATGLGSRAYLLPDSLSFADESALRDALEALTNLQNVIHSSVAE